jgi:hypothetical protein
MVIIEKYPKTQVMPKGIDRVLQISVGRYCSFKYLDIYVSDDQ